MALREQLDLVKLACAMWPAVTDTIGSLIATCSQVSAAVVRTSLVQMQMRVRRRNDSYAVALEAKHTHSRISVTFPSVQTILAQAQYWNATRPVARGTNALHAPVMILAT